eukprot:TRINITY_DN13099_c0_g1_i2.p1 TRINITY_DN13099_c0_g1~~TRINITY_DN13099_c0_g1_i2.p1  ORF type:complete len:1615 (+),score=496.94 TRINITY_DN13099_c0_g1_i2:53-4846(+)
MVRAVWLLLLLHCCGMCAAQPFFGVTRSPDGLTRAPAVDFFDHPTATLPLEGWGIPIHARFPTDPALSAITGQEHLLEVPFGEPIPVVVQLVDAYGNVAHDLPQGWSVNVTAMTESGQLSGATVEYRNGAANFTDLRFVSHPEFPGHHAPVTVNSPGHVVTRLTFRVDTEPSVPLLDGRLLRSGTVYLLPAVAHRLRFSLSSPPAWPAAVRMPPDGAPATFPVVTVDLVTSAGEVAKPNPYPGLLVDVAVVHLNGSAMSGTAITPDTETVLAEGSAVFDSLRLQLLAAAPGGIVPARLSFRAGWDEAHRAHALPVSANDPILSPGFDLVSVWATTHRLDLAMPQLAARFNETLPDVGVRLLAADGSRVGPPAGATLDVACELLPSGSILGGPRKVRMSPEGYAVFSGMRFVSHGSGFRLVCTAHRAGVEPSWPASVPLPAPASAANITVTAAPLYSMRVRMPAIPAGGVAPGHPLQPVFVDVLRSDGTVDTGADGVVEAAVHSGGWRAEAGAGCRTARLRDGTAVFTTLVPAEDRVPVADGGTTEGAHAYPAHSFVTFTTPLADRTASQRVLVSTAERPETPLAEAATSSCLAPIPPPPSAVPPPEAPGSAPHAPPLSPQEGNTGPSPLWGRFRNDSFRAGPHIAPLPRGGRVVLAEIPGDLGGCIVDTSCLPPTFVPHASGEGLPPAALNRALLRTFWMNDTSLLHMRSVAEEDWLALAAASGKGWVRLFLNCRGRLGAVCAMFPIMVDDRNTTPPVPTPTTAAFDVPLSAALTGLGVKAAFERDVSRGENYNLSSFSLQLKDELDRHWSEDELLSRVRSDILHIHGEPSPPLHLRVVLLQSVLNGSVAARRAVMRGGVATFSGVVVGTGNPDVEVYNWQSNLPDLGVYSDLEVVTQDGMWRVSGDELRRSWREKDGVRWEANVTATEAGAVTATLEVNASDANVTANATAATETMPPALTPPPRFIVPWHTLLRLVPTRPQGRVGNATTRFLTRGNPGWDEVGLASGQAAVVITLSGGAAFRSFLPLVPLSIRSLPPPAAELRRGEVAAVSADVPVCPDTNDTNTWPWRAEAVDGDVGFDAAFPGRLQRNFNVTLINNVTMLVELGHGWRYDTDTEETIEVSLSPDAMVGGAVPALFVNRTVTLTARQAPEIVFRLAAAVPLELVTLGRRRQSAVPVMSAAAVRRGNSAVVLELTGERWAVGCTPRPLPGRIFSDGPSWANVTLLAAADCSGSVPNASRLVALLPRMPGYVVPRVRERVILPRLPKGLVRSCLDPELPGPMFEIEEGRPAGRTAEGYEKWKVVCVQVMMALLCVAAALTLPTVLAGSGASVAAYGGAAAAGDSLLQRPHGDACRWILGGTEEDGAEAAAAFLILATLVCVAVTGMIWFGVLSHRRSPRALGNMLGMYSTRLVLLFLAPLLAASTYRAWQDSGGEAIAVAGAAAGGVAVAVVAVCASHREHDHPTHWLLRDCGSSRFASAVAVLEPVRLFVVGLLASAPSARFGAVGPIMLAVAVALLLVQLVRPLASKAHCALAGLRAAGEVIMASAATALHLNSGAVGGDRRDAIRAAAETGFWFSVLAVVGASVVSVFCSRHK